MSDKTRQTYVRAAPCVVVPDNATPLYIPHRSRNVPPDAWCDYNRPVPPAWAELAARENGGAKVGHGSGGIVLLRAV